MKKIGIVTFHYVNNYGAILQCFALAEAVNRLEDCQAEIVNYIPPGVRFGFGKNFLKAYCNIQEEPIHFLTGNQYDYYCVGSDQIWNPYAVGTEYFLEHLDDEAQKISYAASLGVSGNHPRLPIDYYKEQIFKFQSISLRETEHIELIEELTQKPCTCVVDPTLLLEERDYLQLMPKEPLRKEKFIFFFWLEQNGAYQQGLELVNKISRKYDLPIVHSLFHPPSYALYKDGGSMLHEGVENFLWYMKNAEYVVTNSYHGTLFAIQFKRPFYTFNVESMRSRIDTLVEKIGIGDRVVTKPSFFYDINNPMDYESIYKKITKEKEHSIGYLKRALHIYNE